MKLSALSIALGLVVVLSMVWALLKPRQYAACLRGFPRSTLWGYVLMALGTAWFLYYLSLETVTDFADYKNMMYIGFATLGLLSCVFLQDFLAVRGLAVVLLLLAKLIVDSARWCESPLKLTLVIPAYVLVLASFWFTVSPWRCRDWVNWISATEGRLRLFSGARLAYGLLLVVLGFTVF
jgi:hypothetical protein